MGQLEEAISRTHDLHQLAITDFAYTEGSSSSSCSSSSTDGGGSSSDGSSDRGSSSRSGGSLKLHVQVLQQRQPKASSSRGVAVQGWVDSELLPTASLHECAWAGQALWDAFWAACRTRIRPHMHAHRFPRFTSKGGSGKGGKVSQAAGEEAWCVYEIRDFRGGGREGAQFRVCWVDFPNSDNTWEPLDSLKQPLHTYCWVRPIAWQKCCAAMAAHAPRLLSGALPAGAHLEAQRQGLMQQGQGEERAPKVSSAVCGCGCG